MKPKSVLAAVSIALLAVACRKDEPASETNTTSAPIGQEQPALANETTGTTTTGTPTDLGNTQGGGAQTGTTQSSTNAIQKGQDAGALGNERATGPMDRIERSTGELDGPGGHGQGASTGASGASDPSAAGAKAPAGNKNHSTPLGDGKSGSYTDNKGTHGGKATWGTGPQKDTEMDKPAPPRP